MASKLRLDRSVNRKQRETEGLPHVDTISKENFMAWTLDTWRIQPASAKKIGHPAPFPIELPRRLIELYSYQNDLILDPFCGAGTTAVAAKQVGRKYIGYDTDSEYIDLAQERLKSCT